MTDILQYKTRDGIVSIEVEPAATDVGAPRAKGYVPAAKGAVGKVIEAADSFDDALGALRGYANGVTHAIGGLAARPEEAKVEFSLKFTAKAGIVVTGASGEAQMKVTLTWKPEPAGEA